eukprot:9295659-Prorocentrum_lima.AAC.1
MDTKTPMTRDCGTPKTMPKCAADSPFVAASHCRPRVVAPTVDVDGPALGCCSKQEAPVGHQ